MFTRKQIEEIAAKLADLAIKDSQFKNVGKPLNGSEGLPVIQDGENKLMTLSDLINLITGGEDKQYIKCVLSVNCRTNNAIVEIKGQNDSGFIQRTTYNAYYGEIVDVRITADNYDTWQGAITMTQDHALVISLNKTGSATPTPTPVESYYVRITNTQGARIELNGTQVSSGSINYFTAGETVSLKVTLTGYDSDIRSLTMNKNYDLPIELTKSSSEGDGPFIHFIDENRTISADGETVTTSISSNTSWEITASEVYNKEEGEEDPDTQPADIEIDDMTLFIGEEKDII